MAKVNVEKLDEQKKIAILKKAIEKLGLSYISRQIGVDRSTLNRYVNGKIRKIPDEVIEKASDLLTVEELSDVLYGLKTVDVDPTTAISVIIKAKKDEAFRNFFLTWLWQELGEYMKEPSNTYIVSDEDIKLFEKITSTQRAKSTAYNRVNSLKRALAELNYELTEIVITPDGFVIPFETVYPKLLKDPSRVKYFYNIRKDDIRKALNKEYLDTIKRIAMKWED